MKRWISLLLCSCFLIGLAACSPSSGTDTTDAAPGTNPQTTGNDTDPTTSGTPETDGQTTGAEETEAFEIISDKRKTAQAFDASGTKTAQQVGSNELFGMRISCTAPVIAFAIATPTWETLDSGCDLSVYKWAGDYESTISQAPLASRTLTKIKDNSTNSCNCDLPAGEYLFCVEKVVGTAGVYYLPKKVSNGYAYYDGMEIEADLELTIIYSKTPAVLFAETESILNIDGNHTPPAEVVMADDDIINVRDAMPDTWVAIDGLGREVATNAETGDVKGDRTVAMFYWSWHNSDSGTPFNVTNFMKEHPELKNDYTSPLWPKTATTYCWDESIFGHYLTTDKWVIRKHAEMLAAAGVDVIFFDNTNGTMTWRSSYQTIFKTFMEARDDGVKTPKISFMLPFGPGDDTATQLEMLYLDIYRNNRYQELWYYLDGKPMIMAHGEASLSVNTLLQKEIKNFFTFRGGQPAYQVNSTVQDTWGWLSTYPQALYYTKKDGKKVLEQMTVGVAQNWNAKYGLTAMNGEDIFGRAYTSKGFDTREDAKLYGANFSEQFDYALEVDPPIVFVTGWNEWKAGRYEFWPDNAGTRIPASVDNAFPDTYNEWFSRDIEPTKGDLKDHYYYLLTSYIRKYKGTRPVPEATAAKTIDIAKGAEQWSDVGPYYVAYKGNTFNRDGNGYGGIKYTNTTGRNDIVGAKVARDSENLYFYVECKDVLSPYTDNSWMHLYLDTVNGGLDGWESFDYVINKTKPTQNEATLEKFTGKGFETTAVGQVQYTVNGNVLQIKVPKAMLGISGNSYTVNFKWTDNTQLDGDIMDFYSSGDVAPLGRFKFQYNAK